MNRGEIWWIDFDPAVGGEIRKKRPAIIVSNNAANSKQRMMNKAGELSPEEMVAVELAIQVQLGLS